MTFITGFKAELFLLRRLKGTWWLLLIPSLAAAARLALAKVSEMAANAQASLDGEDIVASNGYGFFVDGLASGFILLYLAIMAYAAYGLAFERDMGMTRHLIIRSVSRANVLWAKFSALLLLSFMATLLLLASSYGLSTLLWELGPVVEDGYELIDEATIRAEISLGLQLALFPLPAAIALGLLFAVVGRSATQAVTLAIGSAVVLSLFGGAMGTAGEYLFIHYQPTLVDRSYLNDVAQLVRGFSDVIVEERRLQLNRWLPLPQALLLLMACYWVTRKKIL